jgi:hypothetical protein
MTLRTDDWLDPHRPASGSYERISIRKSSRTDPDANPMSLPDGRTVLGYQDHYLVDGGKARIILHAFVTLGDVSESQALIDQLQRTLFRRKLRPERLIADARYGIARNVCTIEELGIRAYMPLHEGGTSSPFYRHTEFTYDADRDVYHCPQGAVSSSAIKTTGESTGSIAPMPRPAMPAPASRPVRQAARVGWSGDRSMSSTWSECAPTGDAAGGAAGSLAAPNTQQIALSLASHVFV